MTILYNYFTLLPILQVWHLASLHLPQGHTTLKQ